MKDYGANLGAMRMQTDYRLSHNGYGLLQLDCTFACDGGTYAGSIDATFPRGAQFPLTSLSNISGDPETFKNLPSQRWTLVRAEESGREGNVVFITAHYAAISKYIESGITETEATITSSSVSEPITSHPNFTKRQLPQLGGTKPLGGEPPVNTLTVGLPDSKTRNPYNAKWIPSQTGQTTSYQFVDFLPSQKLDEPINRKAGVKSYFRPSITMRLTGYTDNAKNAIETVKYVWWSTTTGVGMLTIPGIYQGLLKDNLTIESDDPQTRLGKNWLITGSNMEVYGKLYKVTADLMLSGIAGWDRDIYPQIKDVSAASSSQEYWPGAGVW